MMLKLKLQDFGHLLQRVDSLEKTDAGRDWGQQEKGREDEMAGWHHRLDGREFEWTLGVGDGQGGLVCCKSWGRKELDTTERLNRTELKSIIIYILIIFILITFYSLFLQIWMLDEPGIYLFCLLFYPQNI